MEEKFKEIVARYCTVSAADMRNDMSFRDDLGLSSLDLMTFLGDLEDEFDVTFDLGADEKKLSGIPYGMIITVLTVIMLTRSHQTSLRSCDAIRFFSSESIT